MLSLSPVTKLLASLWPLSKSTMAEFEAILEFHRFNKSTQLLTIGQQAKNLHFIQKGLARVYYYKNGLDVTDYFALENQFLGATASLFKAIPSEKGIEIIEDAEVYLFNYNTFDQLCIKHPDLERAARKVTIFGMLEEQERIESMRFLSAKERYWQLEKKYPGITNRVSLQHIASYLNTSNVSISRIRAGKQ